MGKSPDAFRTISEVAELLDIPAHVLRFWESRFTQIKPIKRAGGRRYYRRSDILLLDGVRRLLHDDGLTIRGVQKLLREEGVRRVAAHGRVDIGGDDELTDGLFEADAADNVAEAPFAGDVQEIAEPARILPFPRLAAAQTSQAEATAAAPRQPEPATEPASDMDPAPRLEPAQAGSDFSDTGPLIEAYNSARAHSAAPSQPTGAVQAAVSGPETRHSTDADDGIWDSSTEPQGTSAQPDARLAALAETDSVKAKAAQDWLLRLPADPQDADADFAVPPLPLSRLRPDLSGLDLLYTRLTRLRQRLGDSNRRSLGARG